MKFSDGDTEKRVVAIDSGCATVAWVRIREEREEQE